MDIFSVVVALLSLIVLIAIKRMTFRSRPSCEHDTKSEESRKQDELKPISVNYHLTRQCNYKCGFCFHTAKTSYVLPIDEAKKGLKLLKEDGKVSLYIVHVLCCSN